MQRGCPKNTRYSPPFFPASRFGHLASHKPMEELRTPHHAISWPFGQTRVCQSPRLHKQSVLMKHDCSQARGFPKHPFHTCHAICTYPSMENFEAATRYARPNSATGVCEEPKQQNLHCSLEPTNPLSEKGAHSGASPISNSPNRTSSTKVCGGYLI